MADATTVQEIMDYYVNLLIIQYNNKPKARATIDLMIRTLLANGVVLDVQEAYNLDTAVGAQLDVIGKYVGIDRFFENNELVDFFGLTYYTEISPDSIAKWGFTTYTDFELYQYNGTLNYNSVLSQTVTLLDEDYRLLIRLKILQNNINHSHKEIDDSIFQIFGLDVIPSSSGGMHMVYFLSPEVSVVIQAALTKKVLPRPMGVGMELITNVDEEFFGYALYAATPPNTLGFTDYAGYDTNDGDFLIYDRITV